MIDSFLELHGLGDNRGVHKEASPTVASASF